jgi:glycerophosphoryl diester phosphodiesterase
MKRLEGAAAPRCGLDLPPVIGHRGAAGLAPENTLAGLRRACAAGCRWVEVDVRLAADGELVLLHDDRVDRTTNGRGRARRLPSAAIRRYDAGTWFGPAFAGERVPTLAEAIAVLAQCGLGVNIELKCEREDALETGIKAADCLSRRWPPELPPPMISSFVGDALEGARGRAPAIARALLLRRPGGWRRAAALGCVTVAVDHRSLRPGVVADIRAAGYPVLAYTVNDAARARELFGWGVFSVFSDVPQLIIGAIAAGARQLPAPPPRSLASSRREPLS